MAAGSITWCRCLWPCPFGHQMLSSPVSRRRVELEVKVKMVVDQASCQPVPQNVLGV